MARESERVSTWQAEGWVRTQAAGFFGQRYPTELSTSRDMVRISAGHAENVSEASVTEDVKTPFSCCEPMNFIKGES